MKGKVDIGLLLSRNSGKCHKPPKTPMIRLERSAEWRACSLGNANPRQPTSSHELISKLVSSMGKTINQGLTFPKSGVGLPRNMLRPIAASRITGCQNSATAYQITLTRHRSKGANKSRTPAFPAKSSVTMSAAKVGPALPSREKSGLWIGKRPCEYAACGIQPNHVMTKANT